MERHSKVYGDNTDAISFSFLYKFRWYRVPPRNALTESGRAAKKPYNFLINCHPFFAIGRVSALLALHSFVDAIDNNKKWVVVVGIPNLNLRLIAYKTEHHRKYFRYLIVGVSTIERNDQIFDSFIDFFPREFR